MKNRCAKIKSFAKNTTCRVGVLLVVLMLLSFVDSNSLPEDVNVESNEFEATIATDKDNKITYFNKDEYVLSDDQLKGFPEYFLFDSRRNSPYRVIGIETNETETLVDFIVRPSNDPGWFIFSEKTFLRDHDSNDMYKIRSIKGDIPLGKLLVVKGHRGQNLCFTLVFPPLVKDVKKIDIVELESETVNNRPFGRRISVLTDYNINLKKLHGKKENSYRIIE